MDHWATSVFNYENFNGDFKNLFHGTQKVEKQVLKAVSIVQNLPELAEKIMRNSPEKLCLK